MDILPFRKEAAARCMALDEALMEARIDGRIPDTMRLYQFSPSAVSVGYFQSVRNQVNLSICEQMKIDLVRRATGGGSVFHDSSGEITYSVVMGIRKGSEDIVQSYGNICQGIVHALKLLGIEAEFKPINDVLVSGKKISGSAQTRRTGVLLQHGTLMYDTDIDLLSRILNVSKEKLSDKFVDSVKKRVTTIGMELGKADRQEAIDAMTDGFGTVFGKMDESTIDHDVLERASTLSREKYQNREFLFLR
ncbi:MAG: lipoate--protein ligase family protein [Candidatus Methanofastidiosa archaeon]|nr:lipoate--protein ligase family protein [Candidatus Methanofastidiosa archaeon]